MDKSAQVIKQEKEWRLTLDPDRRKTSLARIASVDGLGDRGQFYITAVLPGGDKKEKMVVTSAFLDKSGKKLSPDGKKLFNVDAPLLWKWSEGMIMAKGTSKTMKASMQRYMDVTAVFTPAQEAEWVVAGLL
jgi:hypothetical protein